MPSHTIKANNMCSTARPDHGLLITNDRHLERLMPTDKPMSQSPNHNRTKNGSRVVHVVSCDWQNLRERHPKYHEDQVAQREHVDGYTDRTELERPIRWRRASDFAQEDEKNREEVRYVQREGLK